LEELATSGNHLRTIDSDKSRDAITIGDIGNAAVNTLDGIISWTILETTVWVPTKIEEIRLRFINPYEYTAEEFLFEVTIPLMKREIGYMTTGIAAYTPFAWAADGLNNIISNMPGANIPIIPRPKSLNSNMKDIVVSKQEADSFNDWFVQLCKEKSTEIMDFPQKVVDVVGEFDPNKTYNLDDIDLADLICKLLW